MAEAEALRAKLEREKQELRDFLEQGRHNLYIRYNSRNRKTIRLKIIIICLKYILLFYRQQKYER